VSTGAGAEFLLDANAISHAVRFPAGPVALLIGQHHATVATSVIVTAEITYGLRKQESPDRSRRIARLLALIPVLEFTSADVQVYGQVRRDLEESGTPIGAMDTLIGAHAVSRGLTVITHNVREFQRISGLAVVDWQATTA